MRQTNTESYKAELMDIRHLDLRSNREVEEEKARIVNLYGYKSLMFKATQTRVRGEADAYTASLKITNRYGDKERMHFNMDGAFPQRAWIMMENGDNRLMVELLVDVMYRIQHRSALLDELSASVLRPQILDGLNLDKGKLSQEQA